MTCARCGRWTHGRGTRKSVRGRDLRPLAAHGWLYAAGDAALYDRARAFSPPISSPGSRRPSRRHGRPDENHGAAAEASCSTASASAGRPGNARRAAPRRRVDRPQAAHCARSVQARAGDEPGHRRALRRQPAARGAAGPLFDGQRKLHRPRAVPQRPAGGHRRAEDRLHPERRGRRWTSIASTATRDQRDRPPSRC